MCKLSVFVLGREAARPELRGTTVKEVTAALPFVLSTAVRSSPVMMTPSLPPPSCNPPAPSGKHA